MYQVSITANGGPAHNVTVEVTDVDEPGTVSLNKPQPQVGRSIAAVDFDDPDGTNDKSEAWYSGPAMDGPWTDLDVSSDSYTPHAGGRGELPAGGLHLQRQARRREDG